METLEYLSLTGKRDDLVIADRIRDAVLGMNFHRKITNERLQHVGAFILYFVSLRDDLVAQSIVVRTANVLVTTELERLLVLNVSQDIATFTRALTLARDSGEASGAVLLVIERLGAALRTGRVREMLLSRVAAAYEAGFRLHDPTVALVTVLRRFDATLVEELLNEWGIEGRADEIMAKLKSAPTLVEETSFLKFLNTHRPNLVGPLVEATFAEPKELARRTAHESMEALATLVGLGHRYTPVPVREYLEKLAPCYICQIFIAGLRL